jgi:hypothetical protein
MSTPGQGAIIGSSIIYGKVDYGPSIGQVYRPLNQKRIVTVAGLDTILPYDVYVFYNKTVPAAFSVQLPDCRLWMNSPIGGFDLTCKDSAGNSNANPITFLPFGAAQTINGLNAAALAGSGGGWQLASDFGALIFSPLVDGSGWVTL